MHATIQRGIYRGDVELKVKKFLLDDRRNEPGMIIVPASRMKVKFFGMF